MIKERCSYQKVVQSGDESAEYCTLRDEWCLLESGIDCDVYEEFLKEQERGSE